MISLGIYLSYLEGNLEDFLCQAPTKKRGYCFVSQRAKINDAEKEKTFFDEAKARDDEMVRKINERYEELRKKRKRLFKVSSFDEL